MENSTRLEKNTEMSLDPYIYSYYSLSITERDKLKELLSNKTCMNCTNGSCRIEYSEKSNEITSCIGWENPKLVLRQKISGKKN